MALHKEMSSPRNPLAEGNKMPERSRLGRSGWYILLAGLLVGVIGVFVDDLLGEAEVTSYDGRVRVEYHRLSRIGTKDNLRLTVKGTPGKPVSIMLSGTLMRDVSLDAIRPAPLSAITQGKATLLELGTAPDGTATINLGLKSRSIGVLKGMARIGPESFVSFSTLVLP